jgi:hypothetical protein
MGVDSKHPLYTEHETDWDQMRDTYRGERIVKEAGTKYLPPTSGMVADGMLNTTNVGFKAYIAYRKRARFPDTVREAVEALLGVMHGKPATIELPERMEFLRDNATMRNESLQMFLRRINEEQLALGRTGILADVVDRGERKDEPYLSIYLGERIINWDEGRRDGIEIQNLNFVSIDETEDERIDNFEWEKIDKFRVLILASNESDEAATEVGSSADNLAEGEGVYRVGIFRDQTSFAPDEMVTPRIKGRTLDKIPFVFINTKDITPEPDDPPLLGLSNLTLAIYRGEADYRQSLFMQGQDTLVVIGVTQGEKYRVGAGASIELPVSGDAKYIGVDSQGLAEQRLSLENDYTRAGAKGGQLLDTVGGDKESGEALRIRIAAKTATLNQIAQSGAFGLQTILRIVAEWMGEDPMKVIVSPHLEFADDRMAAKELVELMSAKTLGAPISHKSIHGNMQERGMTGLAFEEELAEIEAEKDLELGGPSATDPDGPEPDEPPADDDNDDDDEGGDDDNA